MHSALFRSSFLRVFKFLQIKDGGSNFWGQPLLQKVWIIWPPLLYFNFKSLKYRISSSFIRFECILHDSAVFFWESSNFYKLKGGNLISGGSHFCRKSELFGPPLLYFNFKNFMDSNFSSFIRFQCILHDSGLLFSEFCNFYKLKRRDRISGGNQFCRKSELFGPPLLYFTFKSFMDPNFSSFIRFECILHDSGALSSEFWNIYKLKRVDLISGGNHFCRKSELFGPPFCISILKVLWTQIFGHSLDFNAFCIIREHFPQSFEVSTNWRGGT